MKKKNLMGLGLTAVLTLGAAFPVWAAAGWVQNNGQWQYQDSYGYIVKNEWQKGADGLWRYLNSSGYIAVNCWVDDEYYVNSEGIMVANNWLQVTDFSYSESGVCWYYFDSKGRKVKDGWKKINDKWYFFNDEGQMATGWVDENRYYTNENGEMLTGWQLLDPPEESDYTDSESEDDPFALAENGGRYWYYFKSNGRKTTPKEDGGENGVVSVEGSYYCMNMDGAIQFGWKNVTGGGSITDYKYFLPNGKMVTGWYTAEPPKSLSGRDDEVHWYYFNSKGVPKADEDGVASTKDLMTLSGKIYLFNEQGNPVTGLRKVNSENGNEVIAYYFGTNENECWAHTGRQRIEEENGEVSTFYFTNSGRGYSGIHDNYLYYLGKIQVAEYDKYELINVPGKDYAVLVNASGKVMKNTTVNMGDGNKYKTNTVGQVIAVNGETVSNMSGRDPVEPGWTADDELY